MVWQSNPFADIILEKRPLFLPDSADASSFPPDSADDPFFPAGFRGWRFFGREAPKARRPRAILKYFTESKYTNVSESGIMVQGESQGWKKRFSDRKKQNRDVETE